MKPIKLILIALAAVILTVTPTLASAQGAPYTSGHARSVSFHDRTPHARERFSLPHH